MDLTAIAASGMQQDLLRMDSISQNIANALTPGYKRQTVTGIGFAQQVTAGLAAESVAVTSINPQPGTLRPTANPLDLAIDGAAYFEVATEQGSAYTRQGAFHTDVRGRLVTASGAAVMGSGGEILLNGAFAVDANGDVRQGDQVVARLKLVNFSNPEALQPIGGGVYVQGGARVAEEPLTSSVRSSFLENSNVNTAQEMVQLTATVRHFEAMQKILQGYDDSLEKTIRKLGEF
ncbi:flagellar hook-basal body complex protein [Duganella sp. FT80W]|uniref:Flagellar hook-basal body complex protein n=1 Tax=Duganella guangzhouensis TaxID=2666084 RepID=A0A6I2L8H8_9BURK|nr:flagellar hook-basal body protein [Duganella guangzhouensis]MRW94163.1 flagellar hook-basal body complex protein [Duganella guangzhouensis]